jgi:hypothetical protein
MSADLTEKTERYGGLLAEAIDATTVAPPPETPLAETAEEFLEMARSYRADGQSFAENDDLVNALAAYAYGHAWLDAGARMGLFDVPNTHLFAA